MKKIFKFADNYVLSYSEYGNPDGFPILAHHGLIASIEESGLFNKLISFGSRIICIARPGYGESSPKIMPHFIDWAEVLSPLIAHLELKQFDVLGMSSGAPYCYALGAAFSDKIRHIFIFSGIPALCEEEVLACYKDHEKIKKDYAFYQQSSISDIAKIVHKMYFEHLPPEELKIIGVRDSMANNCFGIAQDFKLRSSEWGFKFSDISQHVYMQHSRTDTEVPFGAVVKTSELLIECSLRVLENAPHFSEETLNDYFEAIRGIMINSNDRMFLSPPAE